MVSYLVALAIGCGVVLWWRWPAASVWLRRVRPGRLRTAGWVFSVFAVLVCAVTMRRGNWGWPVVLIALAVFALAYCAPPAARRMAPVALTCLGAAGTLIALAYRLPPMNETAVPRPAKPAAWAIRAVKAAPAVKATISATPVKPTVSVTPVKPSGFVDFPGWAMVGRADAWRNVLLLQSLAILAAGLWLIWRRSHPAGPGSGPARSGSGPARSGSGPAFLGRAWGWGLLAPLALAIFVLLVDNSPGHPAAVAAVLVAGLAVILLLAMPRVGADLATITVIALGLCGIVFAQAPPAGWLQGPGGSIIDFSGDWRLTTLAAIEAGTILAFGVWLVPRTVVPHARSVLGTDPTLAGRVQQLTRTRADAVDTAAAELRRVERDLHDGAQARLVALGMNLRAAERLIPTSPQAAIALVAEAREASSKALTELRDLVRGIYPPVLADRGLADAVQALALDTPLRVETDVDLPGRLDAPVESACYFAIAEALANAVKHSGARLVQIRLRHIPDHPRLRPAEGRPVPGVLRIEVTDNGTGGADPARGTGLHGVERRLASFDGILAISSPPGGPTMIIMEVPCTLTGRRISAPPPP